MRRFGLKSAQRGEVLAVLAGLAFVAVVYFMPNGLFERIVRASGLPHILHAATPPLGNTARALMAIIGGILIILLAWVMLSLAARKRRAPRAAGPVATRHAASPPAREGRLSGLRARLRRASGSPSQAEAPRVIRADADLGQPFDAVSADSELWLDEALPSQTTQADLADPSPQISDALWAPDPDFDALPDHTEPYSPAPHDTGVLANPAAPPHPWAGLDRTVPPITPNQPKASEREILEAVAPRLTDPAPAPHVVRNEALESMPIEALLARLEDGLNRRAMRRKGSPEEEAVPSELDAALRDALGTLHRMSGRTS